VVLVDSSAWIEAARRAGSADAKATLAGLLEADAAFITGPVLLEVLGGAKVSERELLRHSLASVPYRAVPDAAWREGADLSARFRQEGLTAPWNDVLLAALAIRWDVRVFALDDHFRLMSRPSPLRLYRPRPGGRFAPERRSTHL
jgi:predicted nucleic acid-binding protein